MMGPDQVPLRALDLLALCMRGGSVMTRVSLFNSPFLLGFDQFERALDRVSKASTDAYPPYNIEERSDDGLRITLAVAGFSMDDLSVQVEDNQLVIRGKQTEDTDKVYLHRGIAARQFQRTFVLPTLSASRRVDGQRSAPRGFGAAEDRDPCEDHRDPGGQDESKRRPTLDVAAGD